MPKPKLSRPAKSAANHDPLLDRFLRYVQVDTQSEAASQSLPTTARQWDLLRLLEKELRSLGLQAIHLSPQGHLMATVPASKGCEALPTVAFLAHVDTAPDFCATGVQPIVHRRWNGKPIRLPDDPARVLEARHNPELKAAIGHDLITASGKTLLGADDKAGVAIILTLAEQLLAQPELPHGAVRVCFLPDEEVGLRGAQALDLDRLQANAGYTLDSNGAGDVVWESFTGEAAVVTIRGVATHPGEAKKQRLVNAVHFAGKLLAALPREFVSPETTENFEGYLHPVKIAGNAACTTIDFLLRDFDDAGIADKRRRLTARCRGGDDPRGSGKTAGSGMWTCVPRLTGAAFWHPLCMSRCFVILVAPSRAGRSVAPRRGVAPPSRRASVRRPKAKFHKDDTSNLQRGTVGNGKLDRLSWGGWPCSCARRPTGNDAGGQSANSCRGRVAGEVPGWAERHRCPQQRLQVRPQGEAGLRSYRLAAHQTTSRSERGRRIEALHARAGCLGCGTQLHRNECLRLDSERPDVPASMGLGDNPYPKSLGHHDWQLQRSRRHLGQRDQLPTRRLGSEHVAQFR